MEEQKGSTQPSATPEKPKSPAPAGVASAPSNGAVEDKPSPGASPAAKAAAAKAAGAAKPAAKAAKAEDPAQPLVDNGNGTVTDPNTGLMWKKADAWLDTQKFFTWAAHNEYVSEINKKKFAGYADWRIPTKSEAMTLFDKNKTKMNMDKNGTLFPIDPVFDSGGGCSTWISECTDDNIIRFDFKIGVDTPYPGKDIYSSIRLVRKAG
ncbi:MAG: hypothetical protein COV67_13980 [Nitrospinae bacterium CG11_big_fil_rev_8_21_14_0_20_56_8]|nr:MAG: hypothetical protein COV67_13980 [Nitrospinae bacterium CG11_big_fil_rev_8_21_14_0_20_56_8]